MDWLISFYAEPGIIGNEPSLSCSCSLLYCSLGAQQSLRRISRDRLPIPDMVGHWSGTMVGYEKGMGHTDYSGTMIFMDVTGQRNRIFWGTLSIGSPWDGDSPEEFDGVIGRGGRTLTIVEQEGG